MKRLLTLYLVACGAVAEESIIQGNVQSKCIVTTTTNGVYGNPAPSTLSTDPSDGGVMPVIRYDVAIADYYLARLVTPTSFSTSPALSDVVAWTGDVSVAEVSDSQMAGYDSAKVTYDATTEFDLTVAGSVWFKVDSTAEYGYNLALPGGVYRAIVQAECIAQ